MDFRHTLPNPINTLVFTLDSTWMVHYVLWTKITYICACGVRREHDKTAYIRTDSPLHREE